MPSGAILFVGMTGHPRRPPSSLILGGSPDGRPALALGCSGNPRPGPEKNAHPRPPSYDTSTPPAPPRRPSPSRPGPREIRRARPSSSISKRQTPIPAGRCPMSISMHTRVTPTHPGAVGPAAREGLTGPRDSRRGTAKRSQSRPGRAERSQFAPGGTGGLSTSVGGRVKALVDKPPVPPGRLSDRANLRGTVWGSGDRVRSPDRIRWPQPHRRPDRHFPRLRRRKTNPMKWWNSLRFKGLCHGFAPFKAARGSLLTAPGASCETKPMLVWVNLGHVSIVGRTRWLPPEGPNPRPALRNEANSSARLAKRSQCWSGRFRGEWRSPSRGPARVGSSRRRQTPEGGRPWAPTETVGPGNPRAGRDRRLAVGGRRVTLGTRTRARRPRRSGPAPRKPTSPRPDERTPMTDPQNRRPRGATC